MAGGRPTAYKPEFAGQAEKLCALGATDLDLADFFDVSDRTIYRWKHEHEEFCQALKSGKDAADERVERSLYHKAVGYSFDAVKIFNHQGKILKAPYREHVPPDTTAAIFWLKNRRADAWRDKREVEWSRKNDPADWTREELMDIAKQADGGSRAVKANGGNGTSGSVH